MKKIYLNDVRIKGAVLLKNSTFGSVYRLVNGDFLKIFDPFLKVMVNADGSLEDKIMSAKPIEEVPEIIIPSYGVYHHERKNEFLGYITPPAEGVDFNDYDRNYTLEQRANLVEYGQIFKTLSDTIERANRNGIVFPDLCTCDNIFISGGKISFIDYDGLQIGHHKVYAMSTTLGPEEQYYNRKYYRNELFTPELDKKSILLLYFLTTFNVDLNKVGKRNPATNQIVSLAEVFSLIGLDDIGFMRKVQNTMSNNLPGEYIGEDAMRIAEEYTMQCIGPVMPGYYVKKLIKR